jgi:hypothetical protein
MELADLWCACWMWRALNCAGCGRVRVCAIVRDSDLPRSVADRFITAARHRRRTPVFSLDAGVSGIYFGGDGEPCSTRLTP